MGAQRFRTRKPRYIICMKRAARYFRARRIGQKHRHMRCQPCAAFEVRLRYMAPGLDELLNSSSLSSPYLRREEEGRRTGSRSGAVGVTVVAAWLLGLAV